MAKLDDRELVSLIEGAIDRYVTARSVNPDNVCRSVAEIIVAELDRAGLAVIREERLHRTDAPEAALRRRDAAMPA